MSDLGMWLDLLNTQASFLEMKSAKLSYLAVLLGAVGAIRVGKEGRPELEATCWGVGGNWCE